MIGSGELRRGATVEIDGALYQVVESHHVKTKKSAVYRVKLRDLRAGHMIERTFNAGEKLTAARVERRPMQYLYADGGMLTFMNTETYDQLEAPRALVADQPQQGIADADPPPVVAGDRARHERAAHSAAPGVRGRRADRGVRRLERLPKADFEAARGGLEALAEGGHRHLARARPGPVAAHAVGHHQQQVGARAVPFPEGEHAEVVLLAVAGPGDLVAGQQIRQALHQASRSAAAASAPSQEKSGPHSGTNRSVVRPVRTCANGSSGIDASTGWSFT